jgi:uncharacterized protein (TIRG00374 family)
MAGQAGQHSQQAYSVAPPLPSPAPFDTPEMPIVAHGTIEIRREVMKHTLADEEEIRRGVIDHALLDEDEDIDISLLNTHNIMTLSGMLRAVQAQKQAAWMQGQSFPISMQVTGPFPLVNYADGRPLVRVLSQPLVLPPPPVTPLAPLQVLPPAKKASLSAWRRVLDRPAVRIVLGLALGILLLYLITRFVDLPTTIQVVRKNLATPRGVLLGLLSGVALIISQAIRGLRWRLFLSPLGKLGPFRAMQIFLIGAFLNFLLPIRGGEVAKCLIVKRLARIPVSQSLPTIAMDRALDLMPALVIMAIVPLLGVHMSLVLWLVLGLVGSILVGLVGFVILAAKKRDSAIMLLHSITGLLPKGIGSRIEGFATGFVDALLIGATQPRIFLPAVLITVVAIFFEGLFAMLAFWTIGYQIPYGTALFGYTVYNMFFVLPNPPGQVGSNEINGLLVFHGLLNIDAHYVAAMFLFTHPWSALLLTIIGLSSLSALGLTISSAMKDGNATTTATS